MYAIAVPVVNDTNALDTVTFMPVASVLRASVLHMVVAHVKSTRQERPCAPSITACDTMVTDASRVHRPRSMALSHQRSHTPGNLQTPAQVGAVECLCPQTEYIVIINFNDITNLH